MQALCAATHIKKASGTELIRCALEPMTALQTNAGFRRQTRLMSGFGEQMSETALVWKSCKQLLLGLIEGN